MRTLSYFIGATIDGYIAAPNGDTSRFEQGPEIIAHLAEHHPETLPTPARSHLGIDDTPPTRFDTVLMGRDTYDVGASQGLTNPYAHLQRQIVCSTTLAGDQADPAVELWTHDLVTQVRTAKEAPGLGIWLCGGGKLASALLHEIDELIIKRQPLVLGAGRPLFAGGSAPASFDLVDQVTVGSVTIETHHRSPI